MVGCFIQGVTQLHTLPCYLRIIDIVYYVILYCINHIIMLYCIILYSDSNCSCNCNCIVLYSIKRSRHQRLHTGFAATFSCKKGRFPHGFPVLPTQDSANRAGFYTYFKGKITNHWFILLHFFFGRQKCPGQATKRQRARRSLVCFLALWRVRHFCLWRRWFRWSLRAAAGIYLPWISGHSKRVLVPNPLKEHEWVRWKYCTPLKTNMRPHKSP